MSRRRPPWTATVRLSTGSAELARWLEGALVPEAAREVPRARTTVRRKGASVELALEASDAGAMRAALNTYLGWVALALATVGAAGGTPTGSTSAGAGEALISRSR